jgi:cell division initiation protein
MKITPLEIRQKTFERTLRGYDKDEVNAFLLSLSQEWERLQDEAKELRFKLEATEREVAKLREVESSLYKTLKTAEDTGANVIEQANKSAELLLREAQLKSEALLNEAKLRAKNALEEADAATRQMVSDMEEQLRAMAQQYKTMQLHRDNLLADLKRLAGETMDRLERFQHTDKSYDPDQQLAAARREVKKVVSPNGDLVAARIEVQQTSVVETKVVAEGHQLQQSFFDSIA